MAGMVLKKLGDPAVTQIYGMEENNAMYQINAKSDIHNSIIGFKPGNDRNFTLKFTHQGINTIYNNLYLVDMVANQTVDVYANGTEYTFTSTDSDPVQRFKIITNLGIATDDNSPTEFENNMEVFKMNNKVVVNNRNQINATVKVFDEIGRCITNSIVESNSQLILNENLAKGVYVVHLKVGNYGLIVNRVKQKIEI